MIHIYEPETEQFVPSIEDESIKAVAQLEAALVKKTGCYISLSCKKLSCIDFRGADQLA